MYLRLLVFWFITINYKQNPRSRVHTWTHTTLHSDTKKKCSVILIDCSEVIEVQGAETLARSEAIFFFTQKRVMILIISIIILPSFVPVRLQWILGCLGIIQWHYLSVSNKQHRSSIDQSRVAHDSYFRSVHRIILLLPSVAKSEACHCQPSHCRNYLSVDVSIYIYNLPR